MLKFKVNGKVYEVTYENLEFNISSQDFDVDNVVILCNGKEINDFGESFIGHVYTGDDVLLSAILAYVNNDVSYDFISVPDEIKKIRSGFFKKQLNTNGRDIPKQFLTPDLNVCDVKMITKEGQAVYLGVDSDSCILTYKDGSIATDMESFFMSGVEDLYEDSEIVYIDPDFKLYLDELFIDDVFSESVKAKYIVNKILEGADVRTILK